LLTLLIILCLISLVWCFNLLRLSPRDLCQPVHYSLAAMMLILLYLIYLFECLNCRTRLELARATKVRFTSDLKSSRHSDGAAVLETEAHDRVITSVKQHFINESTTFKFHLTFVKELIFADEVTRRQYEEHKSRFMKLQQSNDDFVEIKEGSLSQPLVNVFACTYAAFLWAPVNCKQGFKIICMSAPKNNSKTDPYHLILLKW
uniref:RGS domain-containing protein n=1 Tax=Hydatigena taeniaeformis TaxID=6205 RepID=A0A0R3WKW4_HYDTA